MHNCSPTVMCTSPMYIEKLLKYLDVEYTMHGRLFSQSGFDQHNHLVNINSLFSLNPNFDLVDRTSTVLHPLKYHVNRPWRIPDQELSLEQTMQSRVENISTESGAINIFWSGGIDSTAVVTAFLKYCNDLSRIRILYSPWSTYEHPEFLDFIKQWPEIDLVDISGDVYMNHEFDGVFVTGDGGDETNASLDQSFFSAHGADTLSKSWKDFFYKQNHNVKFIEFCEQYFTLSGRPISTVLEARWWFYISCKMTSIMYNLKLPYFVSSYQNFDHKKLISFFNCDEYESFIYFNTDKILPTNEYISWKQYLKDFCYQHNKLETWYQHHRKVSSSQIIDYAFKKIALVDSQFLMILSDGSLIRTPSLPLFSAKELKQHCHYQLQSVINDPN